MKNSFNILITIQIYVKLFIGTKRTKYLYCMNNFNIDVSKLKFEFSYLALLFYPRCVGQLTRKRYILLK